MGDRSGVDAVASKVAAITSLEVCEWRSVGSSHGAGHYRSRFADGRELFVKSVSSAEGAAELTAEANGLRWLGEAGAVPVPEVMFCAQGVLGLSWITPAGADRSAAECFGRDLARMHAAASDGFGAPWQGFIASLPLPNDRADSWPTWYAERRLLPYCRLARDMGTFGAADVRLIESVARRIGEVAGPGEPAARIHGDCWSGNVIWSVGRGWLIDPAAHGGHRETDLAMLHLFGCPHLDRVLEGYRQAAPLAEGWEDRIGVHQLFPLLVHAVLFGRGYAEQALAVARRAAAA